MSQTTVAPDAVDSTTLLALARSFGSDPAFSTCRELEHRVDDAIIRAFGHDDAAAELDLHRFLYEISAHRILPPWSPHWRDYEHPVLLAAHRKAGEAWLARDLADLDLGLDVPASARPFIAWAEETCKNHASGVDHPLFTFLAEDATFGQLRTFIDQETPFDIHFGDLLALLLPGVHGGEKIELAGNFWDEMGRGAVEATHRRLRLSMMERVGVPADAYLVDVERFWLEELRLANMYFQASTDRRLAPQAVGMLMATELVVPGRIDRQIDGWRRLGLTDQEMHYLREHVTVDVEHAQGWLDNVVIPIAEDRPDLMPDMAIGVLRRLDGALGVCERAWNEFRPMA
ncbi:iron-containing redox enzyme family protein [Actinomadura macra]|uniref:iron-containing redox enzyme family protein n=1 Tax=Actinomadura macra TaxID=46164 RepID=UPI00082D0FAD|nr:iron-containing redox enzyme family protein [Actinomadura macra]